MGSRSQWRCTPVVTVRTAADVTAIFYLFTHLLPDLQHERTYTATAAVTCVCLDATMAHVSGEKAPAFTAEEFKKLVNGVLPQYTSLYGPPDKQVSAHQKKGIWRAIAKEVRTLGVFDRRSTHCRKRWEDLGHWSRKTAEAQLELASQQGRGARCTMTPLMFRILAVAYPELDVRLTASQQPQGGVDDKCEMDDEVEVDLDYEDESGRGGDT
ncbi:hypothetical protein NDU88_004400 [Pleurodeles waltl]|uniref:Myb/SANT-like DNA-binding domain-containing protein n=1 Tax=Pleurodeles waltl TaxID=8319 RepID=A0AAV7NM43_PLEWA|nr:hypothetical protein NDU88_004400 [Pleurodeles waltl]